MAKDRFTIGVFAIIFDKQKRVLFCHRRDYDLWNLPGGGLEKGEIPWQGIIREVKEETGLIVKVERLAGIYSKPAKDEIVFQFICNQVGGALAINEEANEIQYFALNKIPKNTAPKQVERIKDFFNNDNKVFLKAQKGMSSIELVKQGKL